MGHAADCMCGGSGQQPQGGGRDRGPPGGTEECRCPSVQTSDHWDCGIIKRGAVSQGNLPQQDRRPRVPSRLCSHWVPSLQTLHMHLKNITTSFLHRGLGEHLWAPGLPLFGGQCDYWSARTQQKGQTAASRGVGGHRIDRNHCGKFCCFLLSILLKTF